MARSPYNRSPSPGFDASSQLSDSSIEDNFAYPEPSEAGQSISRQGSPSQLEGKPQDENGVDTMTCQWEECGKIFNHLPSLIDHIHNDHIGVHKSNYTCEWKTCPRRGIAQTSRFALISHIRSHTGEKPFICQRPECDKSFTRSDALAKHMRIQHNILPPLPGRGGNRKRKREEPEAPQPTGDGYGSFKVEQQHSHASGTAQDYYEDGRVSPLEPNGYGEPLQNGVLRTRSDSPDGEDDSGEDEGIPPHLMSVMDPGTGLIRGRSPAMVKYLLMKAKHKYVLGEHEDLIEELRTLRHEEKCWRERKDALLDEVLRSTFGGQAEELTMLPPVHAQSVPVHRGDVEEDEYV